jgi:hypothetical protein
LKKYFGTYVLKLIKSRSYNSKHCYMNYLLSYLQNVTIFNIISECTFQNLLISDCTIQNTLRDNLIRTEGLRAIWETRRAIFEKYNYKAHNQHIKSKSNGPGKPISFGCIFFNYFCHPMGYSRALQNDQNTLLWYK